MFRGSLFVIQVGAGVASGAALRRSAFVCVCVASLCARVRFLPGSPRSRFPAAGRAKRAQRAQRAVRAKRPRCSKDKTGTNTVASRSAVAMPLARVVKITCVCVGCCCCVSASVCLCVRVRRGWRKFGEAARTRLEDRTNLNTLPVPCPTQVYEKQKRPECE